MNHRVDFCCEDDNNSGVRWVHYTADGKTEATVIAILRTNVRRARMQGATERGQTTSI